MDCIKCLYIYISETAYTDNQKLYFSNGLLPKDVQLIPINNDRRIKAEIQLEEDENIVGVCSGIETNTKAKMPLSQIQAKSFSSDVILVLPFAVANINDPERRIASTYCRRQMPHKVSLKSRKKKKRYKIHIK